MSLKGTLVLIKVGSDLLVGQRSMSKSTASTMIETSSKTTGDDATFVSGRRSSTMSVSGIASTTKEATLSGYHELDDAQKAGTLLTVTWSAYTTEAGTTPVVGDEMYTATAYVSNLTWEAPDNAENTFSCDLQITGPVTKATNSGS